MAEEVVVRESLSEAMINAGAELTHSLDDRGWPVAASLWFYFTDIEQWRLLLASPRVSEEGPKKAYQHVREALRSLPEDKPKIRLQYIAVAGASDSLVSLLRTAVRTGEEITGIRFSQNVINGHLIEDAYIYKMT